VVANQNCKNPSLVVEKNFFINKHKKRLNIVINPKNEPHLISFFNTTRTLFNVIFDCDSNKNIDFCRISASFTHFFLNIGDDSQNLIHLIRTS
jgi:hypothetical protein